jgi:hypothetical protein
MTKQQGNANYWERINKDPLPYARKLCYDMSTSELPIDLQVEICDTYIKHTDTGNANYWDQINKDPLPYARKLCYDKPMNTNTPDES